MTPAPAPLILDEQDFEEIDRLLEALGADDGLRLDGAQGLLTALIVGPQEVGPEDWLPVILGGEPLGAAQVRHRGALPAHPALAAGQAGRRSRPA